MADKGILSNFINGLHINNKLRKKSLLSDDIFGENGKAKFYDVQSAREASYNILYNCGYNISGSELFIMGLLESVILTLCYDYSKENPKFMRGLLEKSYSTYSSLQIDDLLKLYVSDFPPNSVYNDSISVSGYLLDFNRKQNTLLEMLMLYFSVNNPSYGDKGFLFDISHISSNSKWDEIMPFIVESATNSLEYKSTGLSFIDLITSGANKFPHSMYDQLTFYFDVFGDILGEYKGIFYMALDYYKEETKPVFYGGSGEALVPAYDEDIYLTGEEGYSKDAGWMPNVVMLAKNVLVWLSQLSKKYDREIITLDQIPEQELDNMKASGFNALWLIGLWERSVASKTIKQWNGNPEAESSAYSLKYYQIADSLGGETAFEVFKSRAMVRGIRLASDMVPNHTAIDSPQLHEHPDWYMQLDYIPYPNYNFTGANLSGSDKYGIFLEDHYFDRTDAAVVFKYINYENGDTRYIYHGNDGTHMPWNDTAQLDYLKADVREAVINIIIDVAKKFPIIRFDAAMTLAKKHFQRLWYPEPGKGGDIPTRSSHGLTKAIFDEFFPVEFWREVVDRIAEEVPNTLLLAEAFWLLEGYFVRTLGMHRVYNSAFMNMLRDEENYKYRKAIKLTLDFDRNILQRYVNFMSNPDEETTIEQFGADDKYFGVCLIMCTLPGLPMFAHGQISGYNEKYGMEYSKAYWDETDNVGLIERHKAELFPVLKRRAIFSEVENFRLYDFIEKNGNVNEDVFAYSNAKDSNRSLVFYNNKYRDTEGYINATYDYNTGKKKVRSAPPETIANALGITNNSAFYVMYKNLNTGLEYIRRSSEIYSYGFEISLDAYKYACFVDFKEVKDNEWSHYGKLCDVLNGRGVESLEEEISALSLGPLHKEIRRLFNPELMENLWHVYLNQDDIDLEETVLSDLDTKLNEILDIAASYASSYTVGPKNRVADSIAIDMRFLYSSRVLESCDTDIVSQKGAFVILTLWILIRHLGELRHGIEDPVLASSLIDEWALAKYIVNALPDEYNINKKDIVVILQQVLYMEQWTDPIWNGDENIRKAIFRFLMMDITARAMKVNKYNDVLWFSQECSELLNESTRLVQHIIVNTSKDIPEIKKKKSMIINKVSRRMFHVCKMSDYRLENLINFALRWKE